MKVLVVSPHCDDECIGMGGTILKYTAHESQVDCLYITGDFNRIQEANKCANILGISKRIHWQEKDGHFRVKQYHKDNLKIILNEGQYDLIYGPNPLELHPDHSETAKLIVAADSITPLCWYEIWTPLQNPTKYVDITTYLSLKRAAIREHQSQLGTDFAEAITCLNRYRGIMHGMNEFVCEAFAEQ